MPQKHQQTNSGTWPIDNTPIKESWRDFRLVFSWDWNSISVYTWGNTGRCTIGLASHHSWMSSIKSATKKATLANFCSATIGHKNIGFWSKEPQCIQNNYKPIDLFIFTVTVIRNWVRITVYISNDVEVPFYCSSKLVWNWFIGCLRRPTCTVHSEHPGRNPKFSRNFSKGCANVHCKCFPCKKYGFTPCNRGYPVTST